MNLYNTTVGGTPVTIASDLAAAGPGINYTLGTLHIGADQLNLTAGSNVNNGTIASLTFGTTTFTAAPTFDQAASTNLTLGAIGGAFAFTKQNSGQMTLSTTATRATSNTTVSGGTLLLTTASALDTGAATLNLNGGSLWLQNDTGTTFNGANVVLGGSPTIESDCATPNSAGVTHTLGTLNMGTGAYTLTISEGSNVNSGTAGVTFGTTTLAHSGATFAPGANTNLTLGALGGAYDITVNGAGQMTLATTSTRATVAGTTTLTAGTLNLNTAKALNTSASAPLYLNGGTLSLNVTAGATYLGTATTVGGSATVQSSRLTSGNGVTQILGTLSIGKYTLSIRNGSNVTGGTAGREIRGHYANGQSDFRCAERDPQPCN